MHIHRGQIVLSNLRFHACHGVMEQERIVGADYRLTVAIDYPLEQAVETDRVEDTLNYATAYDLIRREMQQPSQLLEHVAGRIGKSLMSAFPLIRALTVELTKVNPPMGADSDGASVILTFTNE